MLKGSCCCGAVTFELSKPPSMMATCHCTRCRKVGASVFVIAEADSFRWTGGEALVTRYAPEEGYRYSRAFCSRCGSSLGDAGSDQPTFAVSAHALDGDPIVRNRFHEFVVEKPDWLPICDDARQFGRHPVKG
jgi:hypothetical protein